jgi:Protein of unknown function (DUF2795)
MPPAMAAITRELLEGLLEDLTFPAGRREIVDHVAESEPHDAVRQTLTALPDRTYASAAEVGHALDPVQPPSVVEPPRAPKPESGAPPGHGHYTAGTSA